MANRKYSTVKRGSKKRKLAKPSSTTKLYDDNYKKVAQIVSAEGSSESEVIREIVSDWFRRKDVEALGRNQTEDPIRRIYERVIDEKMTPITAAIGELKQLLGSHASGPQPSPLQLTPLPERANELLAAIGDLRGLLEQTGSDLAESSAIHTSQLDQLQKSQATLHGIAAESFASSWTILDLVVRYLVEINLRGQELAPEAVEEEVEKERVTLRLEGLRKISGVEELLGLPQALRLAQAFLPQKFFPVNGHNQRQVT